MAQLQTSTFLNLVAEKLLTIWGAGVHDEIITRLRSEAAKADTLLTNLAQNSSTFQLTEITVAESKRGKRPYHLTCRGKSGRLPMTLWLYPGEAADLGRQLDAPIDYFND